MSTITFNSNDPRSLRAILLAADADAWLPRVTLDGEVAYGIASASQPGVYWTVTPGACDCPDARFEGLRRSRIGMGGLHTPCKHQLAVRFHELLLEAMALPVRSAPAPAPLDWSDYRGGRMPVAERED